MLSPLRTSVAETVYTPGARLPNVLLAETESRYPPGPRTSAFEGTSGGSPLTTREMLPVLILHTTFAWLTALAPPETGSDSEAGTKVATDVRTWLDDTVYMPGVRLANITAFFRTLWNPPGPVTVIAASMVSGRPEMEIFSAPVRTWGSPGSLHATTAARNPTAIEVTTDLRRMAATTGVRSCQPRWQRSSTGPARARTPTVTRVPDQKRARTRPPSLR